MSLQNTSVPVMVRPEDALPGRDTPILSSPKQHTVLGTDIFSLPQNMEQIYLAAGCYWGVEEIFWQTPGVYTTSVGFMGGYTPNPTYKEVCTGLTGHTETVRVVFNPEEISAAEILQIFFECHDPTSLYRQVGDIGTQYRSAIFFTSQKQKLTISKMILQYQEVLKQAGKGEIVTEVSPAVSHAFYPAEDSHQQYLQKNPDGYRCHSKSGLPCPLPGSGPLAELSTNPDATSITTSVKRTNTNFLKLN
ncbi:MAG: peptide-methionine (S)-S-oxide reductase MsrA [Arcanobacterium sp.]|nr:peptide-methionine (S)-S-oxide reductase MsrA [Arcanobacterium sp.]